MLIDLKMFSKKLASMFVLSILIFSMNFELFSDSSLIKMLDKIILLVMCLTLIFFSNSKNMSNVKLTILFLVAIIFLFAIFSNNNINYVKLIFALNQIIIFFTLLAYSPLKSDLERIFSAVVYLPVFILLLGLIYQMTFDYTVLRYEFISDLYRLRGSLSPAFLAGFALASLYCSFKLFDSSSNPKWLFFLLLNFLILLLTVSRLPIFLGVSLLSYLLFFSTDKVNRKTKLLLLFTGGIVILIFLSLSYDLIYQRFVNSKGSGRELIWDYITFDFLNYYLLTGVGFGQQPIMLPNYITELTNTIAAHNEFLRVFYELGILGGIVFFSTFLFNVYKIYFNSKYCDKHELLFCTLLFLAYSYFDNSFSTLPIFLLFICVCMKCNEVKI